MLGSLYKRNNNVNHDELSLIVSKYFHDRDLVGKRIHEQLATGTIIIINGDNICLTKKGIAVVQFNIIMAKIFNLDMNNIEPNI
jgi:hypothetical protein